MSRIDWKRLTIGACCLVLSGLTPVWGDEPAEKPAPPPEKKEKPEFPDFKEEMEGYEPVPVIDTQSQEPFIPLWYNKKTDSIRAQIPAGMIGKQFIIASSMSGGPAATGFQLDHFLAYFDRMDKKLVLMQVDPRYESGGDKPVADVIRRSYGGDIILSTVGIITLRGNDPIISFDDLFKGDFGGLSEFLGGNVNPGLSKWAKYKPFPQNDELSVDLAFMRGGTGRRFLFHYSLSAIPEDSKGYSPRRASDRVGYFLTVRKDWGKEHNSETLFDRHINRWRLEKRDGSAKLSAPKNPIVWYIEKTVPLQYRRWVKDGILEWNKAFERCGFLDAVEVKQQEDYDKSTRDLDPEDVRYNFFRWIVTGRGFAMGPSRNHPLTGQIFDADIVFDDAMVRHYVAAYERMTGGEKGWQPYNPILADFFDAHPEWRYQTSWEKLLPNVTLQNNPDDEIRGKLMTYMHQKGRPMCECAAGMRQQLCFAMTAMEAKGLGRDSDEFIGQIIKEVVMHEVGHCLGLRHNFKGSTWLTMDEVAEHQKGGDPNVGSVMDYNPPILSIRGEEQGSFTTRSIGPYDYWAIEYGYRPVEAPQKSEEDLVKSIETRVAEAGLDYATDEDTMGILSPDPLSNRFDMGGDVMSYAERQIKLVDDLMGDITKWAVKDGDSYTKLRKMFLRLFGEKARVSSFVARYPGGQYINRDHKGDPDGRVPMKNVEAEKQRDALKFVCDQVFSEDAFQVKPEVLTHLGAGRYWHWDSDEFDFQVELNIHDLVAESQWQCLVTLMNPFTINRIHDNAVRFGEDEAVYTLAEHFKGLTDPIWSELKSDDPKGTEKKPFINSFRRNLQRMHLRLLMFMVMSEPWQSVPADAGALARYQVARLSKRIGKVLKSEGLDAISAAHLEDVKRRIDKALEAEYALDARGGASVFRPAERAERQPISILPNE